MCEDDGGDMARGVALLVTCAAVILVGVLIVLHKHDRKHRDRTPYGCDVTQQSSNGECK